AVAGLADRVGELRENRVLEGRRLARAERRRSHVCPKHVRRISFGSRFLAAWEDDSQSSHMAVIRVAINLRRNSHVTPTCYHVTPTSKKRGGPGARAGCAGGRVAGAGVDGVPPRQHSPLMGDLRVIAYPPICWPKERPRKLLMHVIRRRGWEMP